jgi:hypothetical protein
LSTSVGDWNCPATLSDDATIVAVAAVENRSGLSDAELLRASLISDRRGAGRAHRDEPWRAAGWLSRLMNAIRRRG